MATTPTEIEALSPEDCMALLPTVPIGRLVFDEHEIPAVRVVNFLIHDGSVVIRTAPGSKLLAAVNGAAVAFEVDDIDLKTQTGWTVTVVGHAHQVSEPDRIAEISALPLRPWAPGDRPHVIRIDVEAATGRRIYRRSARRATWGPSQWFG